MESYPRLNNTRFRFQTFGKELVNDFVIKIKIRRKRRFNTERQGNLFRSFAGAFNASEVWDYGREEEGEGGERIEAETVTAGPS